MDRVGGIAGSSWWRGAALSVVTIALAVTGLQGRAAWYELPLSQQDPAAVPQQQTPPQDPLKFTHDGPLLIMWQIKADRVADFESAWSSIRGALAKNANPDLQAFAQSFTVSRVMTGPTGPVIYVFQCNPASKTFSYNPVALLYETLKAPAPDPAAAAGTPPPSVPGTFNYEEATAVYKKLEGAYENITPWPLQKMPW